MMLLYQRSILRTSTCLHNQLIAPLYDSRIIWAFLCSFEDRLWQAHFVMKVDSSSDPIFGQVEEQARGFHGIH